MAAISILDVSEIPTLKFVQIWLRLYLDKCIQHILTVAQHCLGCGQKHDGPAERCVGDDRTGQPTASGTTSCAIPRNGARVAGAQELVSGRVRVDGPGQVVLAAVDKNRQVRPIGNDELQLAARHVVHALVHQSPQPVALALLVSIWDAKFTAQVPPKKMCR